MNKESFQDALLVSEVSTVGAYSWEWFWLFRTSRGANRTVLIHLIPSKLIAIQARPQALT